MAECIHEIEIAGCGVCRPRTPPEPPGRRWRDQDGWGNWFAAGFRSPCAGCGEMIEPGDQIRSDGDGGWLCGDCGDAGGGLHTVRPAGSRL